MNKRTRVYNLTINKEEIERIYKNEQEIDIQIIITHSNVKVISKTNVLTEGQNEQRATNKRCN
jgi:hypothetical protein